MFLSVNDVFDNLLNDNGENPESQMIEGLPVELQDDKEYYYVSGAPSEVNVQLFGNNSNVKRLQTTRDVSVSLYLQKRDEGEYTEHITVEMQPENVNDEVVPQPDISN